MGVHTKGGRRTYKLKNSLQKEVGLRVLLAHSKWSWHSLALDRQLSGGWNLSNFPETAAFSSGMKAIWAR